MHGDSGWEERVERSFETLNWGDSGKGASPWKVKGGHAAQEDPSLILCRGGGRTVKERMGPETSGLEMEVGLCETEDGPEITT